MSLAELLPLIHSLPREEKVQLCDALVAELNEKPPVPDELPPHLRELIVPGAEYPIYTPLGCYEAAFILQEMLEKGELNK